MLLPGSKEESVHVLASTSAIQIVWWLSLAAGLAMVLVTATLLALILRSARRIETEVRAIAELVPGMAESTTRVSLLASVNETAGELLDGGSSIALLSSRIMVHAAVCPSCPACVSNQG